MYAIIGSCPKCGSPIYVPSPWWGIVPPPPTYSCTCFDKQSTTTYTNNGTDLRFDNK